MYERVEDDGSLNAPILLIGEAPGKDEMWYGKPFVGASGNTLRNWWTQAGLARNQMYVTNVLDRIPAVSKGNIDAACKSGAIHPQDLEDGYASIRALIQRMPNLRCIVPVGNYAAYGVTTQGGRTAYDSSRPGITSIRGSVYWYGEIPVVPTIHPAAVMRQPTWEKRCVADWKRIARIVAGEDVRTPERDYILYPLEEDLWDWYSSIVPGQDVVAVDIETWGGEIKCVGMAATNTEAIVIPTTKAYCDDVYDDCGAFYGYTWQFIEKILNDPDLDIVMQNGMFDAWWFSKERGIEVQGYHWDTMAMHHCLDPLDNHSLDYMASIDTYQPYWKDEAKSADEIVKYAKQGMDKLYIYNAIDCCVTHELFEVYYDRLRDRGLLQFYLHHYADMHAPLIGMSRSGVRMDLHNVEKLRNQHIAEARKKRDEACQLAGRPLFKFEATKCERDMLEVYQLDKTKGVEGQALEWGVKNWCQAKGHKLDTVEKKWQALHEKNISDIELGKLLFEEWGAPRGKTTATGRYQVDDISLKSLQNVAKERKRGLDRKDDIVKMVDLVLGHRRSHKLATFVDPSRADEDGFIRCEYRFTTRSGRLASRGNPGGTGANLQNYDRTLKAIFVPSPGNIMLEVDLSQAEGRVVKVLTNDPALVTLASRLPTDGDEHRENAVAIFSAISGKEIAEEDITKDQRQIGKRVVHASNYAMGKNRLSDILLREGYVVTPYEAGKMIDAYKERNPGVLAYQKNVRQIINAREELYTSWGRRVNLSNMRKDDELFKFGYSYTPQSEIGDLTNQYGVKYIHKFIEREKLRSILRMQVHDSVVIDAHPDELWLLMAVINGSLSTPRTYGNCLGFEHKLAIPCEFAIGATWKVSHEWKYLPTEEEVSEAVKEILNV